MEMDPAIYYWLLCLWKLAVWLIELVTDVLFGYTYTRGTAQERIKAQEYAHSAQLVTIKWRAKYTLLMFSTEDNFFYKHEKYVQPSWVLKQKNATLLSVTEKLAIFSVTDPDVDAFDTEQYPFAFISQYLTAKQLVLMPIGTFHQLASEVGDPKVPVGLINMTARCGSTLLAQMIKRVPNTKTLSECWATCTLNVLYCTGKITEAEHRALLKSSFRLLCKASPGEKVERIFMKMTPQNSPQFPIIADLFPQFKLFFNTRHPVPSMKSFKQVFDTMTVELHMKLHISWRNIFRAAKLCFPHGDKYAHIIDGYNQWYQNITDEEMSIAIYAAVLTTYFDYRDIYHHVVLYENLSKDPETEMKHIYKHMDIPMEHMAASLKALEKDSQGGTFGERKKARSFVLPDEQLRQIDQYMAECSLPIRKDMTVDDFRNVFAK